MLLRRVIGDVLRARRQNQHRTLREVSTAANVSLGYLSEVERGQKEASSELLAAICEALGSQLSDVLRDVSDSLARVEARVRPAVPEQAVPALAALAETEITPAEIAAGELVSAGAVSEAAPAGVGAAAGRRDVAVPGVADPAIELAETTAHTVSDGRVSVRVRRNGPLRTTLYARPGRATAELPN